jgi:hypothetical protein
VKYLLLFLLLCAALLFVYWRLRPYIATARRVLGFFRDARRITADDAGPPRPRAASRGGERLVRCASCSTWLPASRALTVRGSRDAYCSHACLERAAAAPRPRAASDKK